jgi:hypothetical protein
MTLLGPMLLTLFAPQVGFSQAGDEQLKTLSKEIEALKEGQKISQELRLLGRDIDALQDGQRALQKDLQEVKTLLQARPAAAGDAPAGEPQNVVLKVEGAPVKGDKSAKLTLIEFSDFQ